MIFCKIECPFRGNKASDYFPARGKTFPYCRETVPLIMEK